VGDRGTFAKRGWWSGSRGTLSLNPSTGEGKGRKGEGRERGREGRIRDRKRLKDSGVLWFKMI
jgi:hypothetical protein